MDFETPIFKNKSLSKIMEDVYNNSKDKKVTINKIIGQLLDRMHEDATLTAIIAQSLKDYLDVAIRNDEHLIKLAGIIQKLITAKSDDGSGAGGGLLTEQEKRELTAMYEESSKQLHISAYTPQIDDTPLKETDSEDSTAWS